MDPVIQRKLLIEEYKGFLQILDTKGVAVESPLSTEELMKLDMSDLKRVVNVLRDLARTPTGPT